jgi:hypothetical protein
MMAAPTPSVAAAAGTAIEVDYMSEQADGAVAISEYSADNETGGSGPSGRTRKPPAKNCKCRFFNQIHLLCFQYIQIEC